MRNVIGAGAVGVVAALAFATPAFACHAVQKDVAATCNDQGLVEITWTVGLDEANSSKQIQKVSWTPQGATWKNGNVFKKNNTLPGAGVTDTLVLPEGQNQASLTIKVNNAVRTFNTHPIIQLPCNVPPPSESPSAPESPAPESPAPESPAPESPSASSSVAPSEVVTPSTTSSSGGSSLPVTGSNIVIMTAIAVLLVGAGVGLFFIARRRQVKFTA